MEVGLMEIARSLNRSWIYDTSFSLYFKQGDRLKTNNYRPISILPYFAKIMEKAMTSRLNDYVEKLALIYPDQFGFRVGHSTH